MRVVLGILILIVFAGFIFYLDRIRRADMTGSNVALRTGMFILTNILFTLVTWNASGRILILLILADCLYAVEFQTAYKRSLAA